MVAARYDTIRDVRSNRYVVASGREFITSANNSDYA